MASNPNQVIVNQIRYVNYESEAQMPEIMELMKNLSEPYSVYTYRYFINGWNKLCFMAYDGNHCIGVIVCKMDLLDSKCQSRVFDNSNKNPTQSPPKPTYKGYIAMLVVKKEYRKLKIGSTLVKLALNAMREYNADEVVLETEVTNKPALMLYENLGFLRDKRFFRYYLNGLDALRLKLWLNSSQDGVVDAMASINLGESQ